MSATAELLHEEIQRLDQQIEAAHAQGLPSPSLEEERAQLLKRLRASQAALVEGKGQLLKG